MKQFLLQKIQMMISIDFAGGFQNAKKNKSLC